MRKVEPVSLREQDSEGMDDVSKSMKTSESAESRAMDSYDRNVLGCTRNGRTVFMFAAATTRPPC